MSPRHPPPSVTLALYLQLPWWDLCRALLGGGSRARSLRGCCAGRPHAPWTSRSESAQPFSESAPPRSAKGAQSTLRRHGNDGHSVRLCKLCLRSAKSWRMRLWCHQRVGASISYCGRWFAVDRCHPASSGAVFRSHARKYVALTVRGCARSALAPSAMSSRPTTTLAARKVENPATVRSRCSVTFVQRQAAHPLIPVTLRGGARIADDKASAS